MNLISSLTDISFSFFDRQELMQVASYAYIKGFDEQKILMNALLKFFQEDQEVICWKKMLETINQSEEAFLNAVETVETEANSESALVNLSYLLSCVHQYRFPDTDISAAFSKAAHAKNSNAQFVLRSSPHDRVKPSYDKLMYCANFLLFTDNRKMPKNRVVAGEVADCYLQNAFQ